MNDVEKIEFFSPLIIEDYNNGQSMSYIAAKYDITYIFVRLVIKKAKKYGKVEQGKTNKGKKSSFNTTKTVGCVSPKLKRKKPPEVVNKLRKLESPELRPHDIDPAKTQTTGEVSSNRGFKFSSTKGDWLFGS